MGANESRGSSSSRNNKERDENAVDLCNHEVDVSNLVIAAVAVAGLALLGYGLSGVFSGSGQRRAMKAPGRDSRIFRDDFERNPSAYFRDLRK